MKNNDVATTPHTDMVTATAVVVVRRMGSKNSAAVKKRHTTTTLPAVVHGRCTFVMNG